MQCHWSYLLITLVLPFNVSCRRAPCSGRLTPRRPAMPTAVPFRQPAARLLAVTLAFLLAWTSSASAQITAATISGTVKDQTGGVLPGADVVIRNAETGLTRTAVTNAEGFFTIPGLSPGTYEARASLQGFTTEAASVALTV